MTLLRRRSAPAAVELNPDYVALIDEWKVALADADELLARWQQALAGPPQGGLPRGAAAYVDQLAQLCSAAHHELDDLDLTVRRPHFARAASFQARLYELRVLLGEQLIDRC